jgi:hypothetical protein
MTAAAITGTPVTKGTGIGGVFLANIGGYGFTAGKLFTPTDVIFDSFSPSNKRIFVANGGGNLTVYGCDNLQPYNVQVGNPTQSENSLFVTWTSPTFSGPGGYFNVYRSTSPNDAGATKVSGPTGLTGTSFTDTGLTALTTYYYTVRAVDAFKGLTEYKSEEVSGRTRKNYTLALTTNGTGTGAINGATNPILDNTLVSLTATPNSLTSIFSGWTGACDTVVNPLASVNGDVCTFTMTASTTSVGATFNLQQAFKVDGAYFGTLQAASDAAQPGSIIQIMTSAGASGGSWPANTVGAMTGNNTNAVTLRGGYDSQYAEPPTGVSVISGRVNVKAGRINITSPVKIKP